jgi:hypothetical protein
MLSNFHIHLVSLAAQEEIAQLASPLAYFFISPENFPAPPFLSSIYRTLYYALSDTSSLMHMHAYVLPISPYTPSSVEWFHVDWCWFWKSKLLTEKIVHAQRKKRFVLGARGGHVACATAMRDWATSNALVEDSFKKSTEGRPDR